MLSPAHNTSLRLAGLVLLAAITSGCPAVYDHDPCASLPGQGEVCTLGVGECRRQGRYTCDRERVVLVCDARLATPLREVCDGLDNDCDGETDEGLGQITCGQGACARTVPKCSGGRLAECVPGDPLEEVCNGLDDDCDGLVDEGIGRITCGVGACEKTVRGCAGGRVPECVPGDPLEEVCNGLDDDCDGETDEGLGETTCGVGACERTTPSCEGGRVPECVPGSPADEVCNGLDDDCDGETDENPDADASCDDGNSCRWKMCERILGICKGALLLSTPCDDGVECTTTVCGFNGACIGEQYEGSRYDLVCYDGLDNDCDGLTDHEEPDCCIPDCAGAECGYGGCPDQPYACGTCPLMYASCVEGSCTAIGLEWIPIAGGTFMMGSPEGVGESLEHPQHQVTVPSFEMLRTEVTVAQYRDCVESGECSEPLSPHDCDWCDGCIWCEHCNWAAPGKDHHPVVCVTWYQAFDFCSYIGGRLPSEAEWEYAARSLGQDIIYPWGDQPATCAFAVMFDGFAGGIGCGEHSEWPVCSKPAGNTAQGLCDMAGNVHEWVQDWRHDDYNGAPSDGSAWEVFAEPRHLSRVFRGGSRDESAYRLRSADRFFAANPASRADCVGFRCARSVSR